MPHRRSHPRQQGQSSSGVLLDESDAYDLGHWQPALLTGTFVPEQHVANTRNRPVPERQQPPPFRTYHQQVQVWSGSRCRNRVDRLAEGDVIQEETWYEGSPSEHRGTYRGV